MSTGRITWVGDGRTYGWIRPRDGQNRRYIFFHASSCLSGEVPEVGDDVVYDLGPPHNLQGKPEAINLRLKTRRNRVASEESGQSIAWLNNK
jgi:cold shock CspA family protein